ncbi:MAG: hypothetical protein Ct9H300mP16_12330 [Pseudomonadota bacterium]|nr:MAG: hypothetical protein Ct9H300mP16_12330 [Pseudomonadota bacterium]
MSISRTTTPLSRRPGAVWTHGFATGRVHCLGLSNFAAWQIVEIIHLARARGWTPPTVTQFLYNTISRGVENELLPMTDAYGLGTCAYNPLAGGLLTGKHRAGQEAVPESRLAVNTGYRDRYWNDRQRGRLSGC